MSLASLNAAEGVRVSRGQTLQYYRSQHEARPRDAINLSAVGGQDRTGAMELGRSKLEYYSNRAGKTKHILDDRDIIPLSSHYHPRGYMFISIYSQSITILG